MSRVRVERRPVADEYAEDGQLVVLLDDGRVVALSPLASALLAALTRGPLALEDLARSLVERFGPPPGDPGGATATRSAVDSLVELGLAALRDM